LEKYKAAGDSVSVGRVLEWMAAQQERQHDFDRAAVTYQSALENYVIANEPIALTRVKGAMYRVVPWGFLLDLKRSQVFPMRGDRFTVGRNEANIQNDLSLTDQYISRRHLVISHDGFQTDDLRSRNGTTVNAAQIPYGIGTKLSNGDIIALAETEVLQFTTGGPT